MKLHRTISNNNVKQELSLKVVCTPFRMLLNRNLLFQLELGFSKTFSCDLPGQMPSELENGNETRAWMDRRADKQT